MNRNRALAFFAIAAMGAIAAAACGEVDLEPQATTASSSSSSGGPSCPTGRADCDGNGSCETLLGTTEDCGGCGDVCANINASATCSSGHCVLQCDEGFADCNGDARDGCEAELAVDSAHCGSCGRSCGDADCFQGACAHVLATSQAALVGADALLVGGDSLYWCTPGVDLHGEVVSVPKGGGVPSPLDVDDQWPERLRSSGEWLVWSNVTRPGIYRMKLPSGAVEIVWQPSDAAVPHLLDVDATRAFFTTGNDVQVVPIAGGAPSVVVHGFVDVASGRLAGSTLYVADLGPEVDQTQGGMSFQSHPDGSIARVDLQAMTMTPIAIHLDTPRALTTSSDALYWVEAGSLATYSGPNDTAVNLGTKGRVMRAGLDGSSPTVIADGQIQPVDLAIDAKHIYWTDAGTVGGKDPANISWVGDGALMRAPIAGGPAEVLMDAIDARSVALDDTRVFFASWNFGVVLAVKKD